MANNEITKEQIEAFLDGSNPQERIIKIESDYNESKVHILYRTKEGKLKIEHDNFYPFIWTKLSVCLKLYGGNRELLKSQLNKYGIKIKPLRTENELGITPERMADGYRFLFYSTIPMSYTKFLKFFEEGGCPVYGGSKDDSKNFVAVSNTEQYMIKTGKRLFKGYENYSDLLKLTFDLETEGLDPKIHAISQIGIRTNKGFEKIITVTGDTKEEKAINELKAIDEFFNIIHDINPDIVTGHNSENFDFPFISTRLELAGTSMKDFTKDYFNGVGIYKKNKQTVLKLGGEVEYYTPTIFWGHNITDSLHAVRRAQAIDSSMKKSNLKYVAEYSKIKKRNRVYIKGDLIDTTWLDNNKIYAFNDSDGHWFKTSEKTFNRKFTNDDGIEQDKFTFTSYDDKLIDNETKTEYEFVTGKYIAERYLLDDLWECEQVEDRYNGANFLIAKLLPQSFEKTCTGGTASIWKSILLTWSYENDLALPDFTPRKTFTGGLSRLLQVGFVSDVAKLDYNSLYPSIILTYGIKSNIDISGAMSTMLEYVLTQREHYKDLKGVYGKKAKDIKSTMELIDSSSKEYFDLENEYNEFLSMSQGFDKKQLPLKILGNSFFGSFGSGNTAGFNWSDIDAAEETTCSGRQCLRLMISHFSNIGYTPLVGDSFTPDTPLLIKYDDTDLISIKCVSDIINTNEIQIDELGREYDYSKKNFKVLCRSGWVEPSYIYRHKTDKSIFKLSDEDKNMMVDVTEDHSLFDKTKSKIKPSEITSETELEYFTEQSIYTNFNTLPQGETFNSVMKEYGAMTAILNASLDVKKSFIDRFDTDKLKTKLDIAVYNFIKTCLELND